MKEKKIKKTAKKKDKKSFWNNYSSFKEAEKAWEKQAFLASQNFQLKTLTSRPKIPGIANVDKKGLRWTTLKYMLKNDREGFILKNFFKHPLKYGKEIIKSLFKRKKFIREKDFFLYGIKSMAEFKKLLKDKNSILIAGFSYCHKPYECPDERFSTKCKCDYENPICQQCFIGKAMNALPQKNVKPLIITTAHYIGKEIFDTINENPDKKIIFIITACEMSLEMFSDWGNIVNLKGIGTCLQGRFCNTMRAFELAENGTKPGLTIISEEAQKTIMELIQIRRKKT